MFFYYSIASVNYIKFFKKTSNLLLSLLPIGLLSVKSLGSLICFLLVFLSLFLVPVKNQCSAKPHFFYQNIYVFAFVLPLFIVCFQYFIVGDIHESNFEAALRFALPLFVFFFFRRIDVDFRYFVVGCFLSIVYIFGLVFYKAYIQGIYRPSNYFMNSIVLNSLVVMLAYFFVVKVQFMNASVPIKVFLIGVSISICMAAIFISQSRGVWLTFILLSLFFVFFQKSVGIKSRFVLLFSLLFLVLFSYLLSSNVRERVDLAVNEVSYYFSETNPEMYSVTSRLEMWKASMIMFVENPMLGVGRGNFQSNLISFKESGIISSRLQDYSEPHNEAMAYLSEQGIVGVFSLLLLYFCPFYLFLNNMSSDSSRVRYISFMGGGFVFAYMITGLTNILFQQMTTIAFYSVMVCLFSSQIIRYHCIKKTNYE